MDQPWLFTHSHNHACSGSKPNLTSSDLIKYYNELVLQLKLAENNFDIAINDEVKNDSRTRALKNQKQIIRLLNESILPALEFTVSYIIVVAIN